MLTEISVTGLVKLVSEKGHFIPILDVSSVANQIILQMNQAFNRTGSWLFSGAPLAVFLGAGIGLFNVTDISHHAWCAYDPKAAAKQAIRNQFINLHSFVLLNVAILASALVFSRQKNEELTTEIGEGRLISFYSSLCSLCPLWLIFL